MIQVCEDQNIYTGSGATLEELASCSAYIDSVALQYFEFYYVFFYIIVILICLFGILSIYFQPMMDALNIGRYRGGV